MIVHCVELPPEALPQVELFLSTTTQPSGRFSVGQTRTVEPLGSPSIFFIVNCVAQSSDATQQVHFLRSMITQPSGSETDNQKPALRVTNQFRTYPALRVLLIRSKNHILDQIMHWKPTNYKKKRLPQHRAAVSTNWVTKECFGIKSLRSIYSRSIGDHFVVSLKTRYHS